MNTRLGWGYQVHLGFAKDDPVKSLDTEPSTNVQAVPADRLNQMRDFDVSAFAGVKQRFPSRVTTLDCCGTCRQFSDEIQPIRDTPRFLDLVYLCAGHQNPGARQRDQLLACCSHGLAHGDRSDEAGDFGQQARMLSRIKQFAVRDPVIVRADCSGFDQELVQNSDTDPGFLCCSPKRMETSALDDLSQNFFSGRNWPVINDTVPQKITEEVKAPLFRILPIQAVKEFSENLARFIERAGGPTRNLSK